MPSLWTETIDSHRSAVRRAIVETAADLVAQGGLRSVTMSQIAEQVGIGRATLYKYFPDVESMLVAWHEGKVSEHLDLLARVSLETEDPHERLVTVLETYAQITQEQRGHELEGILHRAQHVADAQEHLRAFIRHLMAEGIRAGDIRGDIDPDELTTYCLHAVAAANDLPSKAAARRLVTVILAGLQPVQGS